MYVLTEAGKNALTDPTSTDYHRLEDILDPSIHWVIEYVQAGKGIAEMQADYPNAELHIIEYYFEIVEKIGWIKVAVLP